MILELTGEQKALQERVAAFAADQVAPRAGEIDDTGQFPRELVRAAAALGLMGLTLRDEWGGQGRDQISYALAVEVLARASAVMAVIVAVTNSLVAEPIQQFGTDAQKQTWLPRLASGDAIGAFALSEEHAGSDAANQQTVARLDEQGYRLCVDELPWRIRVRQSID
jgi:alkylation response protein AidB-like acyl-CoA dehydrogenase